MRRLELSETYLNITNWSVISFDYPLTSGNITPLSLVFFPKAIDNLFAVGCLRGYMMSKDGDECIPCPKHHYQDEIEQSDCKPCPKGHHQPNYGSSFCEKCSGNNCPNPKAKRKSENDGIGIKSVQSNVTLSFNTLSCPNVKSKRRMKFYNFLVNSLSKNHCKIIKILTICSVIEVFPYF